MWDFRKWRVSGSLTRLLECGFSEGRKFIEVPLLQNPKKRPYRRRYLSILLKHQKIFIIEEACWPLYWRTYVYSGIRQIFILLFKNDWLLNLKYKKLRNREAGGDIWSRYKTTIVKYPPMYRSTPMPLYRSSAIGQTGELVQATALKEDPR